MLYRENGPLGIPLSVISFGGAAVSGEGGGYGFGNMSEEEAEKLLRFAYEIGINNFDTAPIYGFGLSEERFGRYLPKEAVVVTKGGVDWHSSKRVNMTNDPKIIEKMFYESLKRLKRDRIDVYMIHWPDSKVDIRRPMEFLARAQEKGDVHKLGLCNTNLTDLSCAEEIAKIEVLQSELNLFRSEPFENLQDQWQTRWSMSWGTFDKGILSGRVTAERKFDSSDCRSWAPWWNKKEVLQKAHRVKQLGDLLSEYRISLVNFCLNYNLYHFGISTCLVGSKNQDDLVQVTSNLQQNISEEIIKEVLARWHKTE